MTPAELAERWGCSHSSVVALCVQGKLRHFRIGKMYRIPADAIIEYEIGHYGGSAVVPQEAIEASRGSPQRQLAAARDAKRIADEQSRVRKEATDRISRQIRWKYARKPKPRNPLE